MYGMSGALSILGWPNQEQTISPKWHVFMLFSAQFNLLVKTKKLSGANTWHLNQHEMLQIIIMMILWQAKSENDIIHLTI